MKEVHVLRFKEGTDWWKEAQKTVEEKAEEAASRAAEAARKDVLDRAAKIAAENKAYLESIRHYDKLSFKNQEIINNIQSCTFRIDKIKNQLSDEYSQKALLHKELQAKCDHDEVLERRTSWKDEYDDWHQGHYERKCIECHLEEESSYQVNDRAFEKGNKKYDKLKDSKVVLLRKKVGDKEFELEFNDLTW